MHGNALKGYVLKQAKVLSSQELKRVLLVAAAGRYGQRDRIALLLSHYAGLRVGEIASLRWDQVLDERDNVQQSFYLNPKDTKSNEARAVHLNVFLQKKLLEYRVSCNTNLRNPTPIIVSQKGLHFSANSLCQLFGRLYERAGIGGASSHSGRRWFIETNQLNQYGVSTQTTI